MTTTHYPISTFNDQRLISEISTIINDALKPYLLKMINLDKKI